jgi:hypothetical protein
MNSNQRSQGNNQSDNGGNEKSVSSSRGGTVEKDLSQQAQQGQQSQQSGQPGGSQQQGEQRYQQGGSQQETQIGQQSTDRTGSQTGSEQSGQPGQRQSNDLAGGYPRSPGAGGKLAADQDMDDDTGLSNKANRQSAQDQGNRQSEQSNVGRRDDGTPD